MKKFDWNDPKTYPPEDEELLCFMIVSGQIKYPVLASFFKFKKEYVFFVRHITEYLNRGSVYQISNWKLISELLTAEELKLLK